MASPRIRVSPDVVKWAIVYSRREDYLRRKYPKLAQWESGTCDPTMKQLESFARDARVAVSDLWHDAPPTVELPVTDMRTVNNVRSVLPSPNLVDTIHHCRVRQVWYSDYASSVGNPEVGYLGSARLTDDPADVARDIRRTIGLTSSDPNVRRREDYRRLLINKIEGIGVLVMVNSIVGNDTHRKLDPTEFRGFSLPDAYAPVVFVNGADSLSAQVFTLAHELAHLGLGEPALSDPDNATEVNNPSEIWCNSVAARVLVPPIELRRQVGGSNVVSRVSQLSVHFKVSPQVILRCALDDGMIDAATFSSAFQSEMRRSASQRVPVSSGGNHYHNLLLRVGRRFAVALFRSTKGGTTLYRDAYRMLHLKNGDNFDRIGEYLGVA